MDDKQFQELRTLILDQNVKIEALTLAVRKLQQSVETTEVVFLDDPRMTTDEMLRTLQSREPHSGS